MDVGRLTAMDRTAKTGMGEGLAALNRAFLDQQGKT